MKTDTTTVLEFLRQSNNIEGVWDDDSLMQAWKAWEYLSEAQILTPKRIMKTHEILMIHQDLDSHLIGVFRSEPVWVGGREGEPFENIPFAISAWCETTNKSKTEEEIQRDHVDYEIIHPFIDGNGRTGRLFMNWQRVKNDLPILVIKESEKRAYYDWFA